MVAGLSQGEAGPCLPLLPWREPRMLAGSLFSVPLPPHHSFSSPFLLQHNSQCSPLLHDLPGPLAFFLGELGSCVSVAPTGSRRHAWAPVVPCPPCPPPSQPFIFLLPLKCIPPCEFTHHCCPFHPMKTTIPQGHTNAQPDTSGDVWRVAGHFSDKLREHLEKHLQESCLTRALFNMGIPGHTHPQTTAWPPHGPGATQPPRAVALPQHPNAQLPTPA